MPGSSQRIRTAARVALGVIRFVNGTMALFTPAALSRRLGMDPDATPGMLYPWRMFGIRTMLVGAELLLPDGERRARAVRVAPLIHASDVLAATMAFRGRHLPRRAATATVAISAVNVVLSLLAQPPRNR